MKPLIHFATRLIRVVSIDPRLVIILLVVFCTGVATAQITETKLRSGDGEPFDHFGESVSIYGDHAVVGAPDHSDNGAAFIFHREGSRWVEEARLIASDGEAFDYFGRSVSISGDNALVGAYRDDDIGTNVGSAYIFHFDGSNWVEQSKLIASDGRADDYFGWSVSLSGDYALVGSYGDGENGPEAGSAYIFHFDGSNWVEQSKLIASDGAAVDHFGRSVSLSGDYALVGADGDDNNGVVSGSAYIFHFDGSNWVEQSKLIASDGAVGDYFGWSVSLSGDFALVGAYGDDDYYVGSAYIFRFDGSSWVEQSKLIASDGRADDYFGYSVSLSGNYALVGAYRDDDNGLDGGSAYIFHFDGSNWVEQSKLIASDGVTNDLFGYSVSISGDYILVGTWDNTGTGLGSAYVYSGFSIIPLTLTVTLSPSSGGGTFTYDLEFTNNTDDSLTIDAWTEITDPHGEAKTGKILWDKTLHNHRSNSKSGTSTIKENAPLGEYLFTVYSGTFPDSVIASASATYSKTSLGKQKSSLDEETIYTTGLFENYPDPFNPSTTFRYGLSEPGQVSLKVYNLLGQLVRTIVDAQQLEGHHEAIWDGRNEVGATVASGIYVYRLTAGNVVETKRMVLMK